MSSTTPHTLCILPDDTRMETRWGSASPVGDRARPLDALLMQVYTYTGGQGPARIADWEREQAQCGIHLDVLYESVDLSALLGGIVGEAGGVCAYWGRVPALDMWAALGMDPPAPDATGCMGSYRAPYAASTAREAAALTGYGPDPSPPPEFSLVWAHKDDWLAEVAGAWLASCAGPEPVPRLPWGPSPSSRSVELALVGDEADAIGVFVGEDLSFGCGIDLLSRTLPVDTLYARLSATDAERWLRGSQDWRMLKPVREPLPF